MTTEPEFDLAAMSDEALYFARWYLEMAMETKPENHAAYSRWIKAHQHILAARELMKLDGPTVIDSPEWKLKEVSFGCSLHTGSTCCLLKNVHDGRELHIPGMITGLEEKRD